MWARVSVFAAYSEMWLTVLMEFSESEENPNLIQHPKWPSAM